MRDDLINALRPFLDDSCDHCKESLAAIAALPACDTDVYASFNMKTRKRVPGFVLRPDRNSNGLITHWHIDREKTDG